MRNISKDPSDDRYASWARFPDLKPAFLSVDNFENVKTIANRINLNNIKVTVNYNNGLIMNLSKAEWKSCSVDSGIIDNWFYFSDYRSNADVSVSYEENGVKLRKKIRISKMPSEGEYIFKQID